MIRKSLVFIAIISASILLAGKPEEPTSTPIQQHEITDKEYWIDRGYEVIHDWWCAGENIMVQLYKDYEVISIDYEEQQVSSCHGSYDGCYVDFIDEVKVLHTWE